MHTILAKLSGFLRETIRGQTLEQNKQTLAATMLSPIPLAFLCSCMILTLGSCCLGAAPYPVIYTVHRPSACGWCASRHSPPRCNGATNSAKPGGTPRTTSALKPSPGIRSPTPSQELSSKAICNVKKNCIEKHTLPLLQTMERGHECTQVSISNELSEKLLTNN